MNAANTRTAALIGCAGLGLGLAVAGEFPFNNENLVKERENQRHLSVVDLDGDGDQDFLVMGSPSGGYGLCKLHWQENRKKGKKFVSREIDSTLMEADDAAVIDVDGDGDLDVVGTGNGRNAKPNGGVQWWENISKAKVWENHHINHNGTRGGKVGVGDFDGDGDADVVVSSDEGLHWYENKDGKGKDWSGPQTIDKKYCAPLLVMDYDGDKDLDVVARRDDAFVAFLNDGGAWTAKIISKAGKTRPVSLRSRDLNGDGKPDIILGAKQTIQVYLNVGKGRFLAEEVIDSGNSILSFRADAMDVDKDGDMDIVATQQSPYKTLLWFENVDGEFTEWKTHPIEDLNGFAQYLFLADMDGDGDDDVISQREGRYDLRWLTNNARAKKE